MTDQILTDGSPVPADHSHTTPRADGQQMGYVVLTPEERAKGFVKPVRDSYVHQKCGTVTTMGRSLAETYARDPNFYDGTFCIRCSAHFPLTEFRWSPDGEPMHPPLQAAWKAEQTQAGEKFVEQLRQHRREQAWNTTKDLLESWNLLAHLRRQMSWSTATFGPGARTAGVLDHIRKELNEIEAKPDDLSEWVDVILLALDGAWRSGANPYQICEAIAAKQRKNESRVWPDWRTADPGKAIEHNRTAGPDGGGK